MGGGKGEGAEAWHRNRVKTGRFLEPKVVLTTNECEIGVVSADGAIKGGGRMAAGSRDRHPQTKVCLSLDAFHRVHRVPGNISDEYSMDACHST